MDASAERKPRGIEEMVKEAEWLQSFLKAEKAKLESVTARGAESVSGSGEAGRGVE